MFCLQKTSISIVLNDYLSAWASHHYVGTSMHGRSCRNHNRRCEHKTRFLSSISSTFDVTNCKWFQLRSLHETWCCIDMSQFESEIVWYASNVTRYCISNLVLYNCTANACTLPPESTLESRPIPLVAAQWNRYRVQTVSQRGSRKAFEVTLNILSSTLCTRKTSHTEVAFCFAWCVGNTTRCFS